MAIGSKAGCSPDGKDRQHDNSIVLNATGLPVTSPIDSSCVLAPVRKAYNFTHFLTYNEVTGEVCYVPRAILHQKMD